MSERPTEGVGRANQGSDDVGSKCQVRWYPSSHEVPNTVPEFRFQVQILTMHEHAVL